jgi:hypothetical protein
MLLFNARKSIAIIVSLGVLSFASTNAYAGAWVNVTSNLAKMTSECGNLCRITAVPGKNKVIAGVGNGGLWSTTDGGSVWIKMGGAGANTITNRTSHILFDPANADIFWECGTYHSPSIIKTTDGGATFSSMMSVYHNDDIGVDFTDPQRKVIIASGHETRQKLYKSTDGGTNFTEISANFPSDAGVASPLIVINATTYIAGAYSSYLGGNAGIYRTVNGGQSWTSINSAGPSGPALLTSWGTYFWANGAAGSILKSTDNGASWTTVSVAGATGISPVEIPGHGIATIGTGGIVISRDDGATWTRVAAALPVSSGVSGLAYNAVDTAFYIWKNDCGSTVLPDAVWKYDSTGFYVYGLDVNPVRAYNDQSTPATFTVHTGNAKGTVSSVTIDLSSLGGGSSVAMTKGTGDAYTCSFTIAAALAPGTKSITVTSISNSVQKTASTSFDVLDGAAPVIYKGIYTDTANITSVAWVGDGAGNKSTVSEISTDAIEGTNSYGFNFVVGGWWAIFGLQFTPSPLDATGFDYLQLSYKGPTGGFKFNVTLAYPDGSTTGNSSYQVTGSAGWSTVIIPLTYYTDQGFSINNIQLFNIGITGGAMTGSGTLLIDNIMLISGHLSSPVERHTAPIVQKPLLTVKSASGGHLQIQSTVAGIATIYNPSGARIETIMVKPGLTQVSRRATAAQVYLVKFVGSGLNQVSLWAKQ